MRTALFTLSFLTILAGCASSEGPTEPPVGETTATDPSGDGTKPPVDGTVPGVRPDQPAGAGAMIDFGAAPTGAPALSTLSCPQLTMPSAAATIYVDAKATGTEDGTKAAPFRTVAKAFANAGAKGVIWVAAGKYAEQLIVPNKDLAVFGGFASGFGARTNACATTFEAPNANAPVLSAGADVKSFAIEGVTVQKGVRGLLVLGASNLHASFTIARCVFAENGEKNAVGGAVFLDGVDARIFGSVFRDNRASKGAALAGAGDVTLTIDENLFDHNLGYSDHGGGLYINAMSSKIARNTFRGNATGVGLGAGWGGAVIIYANSLSQRAKADFSFNVFTENVAGIGGAVFVDDGAIVTMSHDLVYRNRAYPENGLVRGAALYVDGTGAAGGGSSLTAEYVTVVNNNYDDKGVSATAVGGNVYVEGGSKASFTNSIFWNNGENAFYVEAGQNELTVTNSIGAMQCASSSPTGFITASSTLCKIGSGVFQPAAIYFGDESANDYHEQSTAGRFSKGAWVIDPVTSPAIDKADPTVKVANEPMPNGNRANLGAFSQTDEASMSP